MSTSCGNFCKHEFRRYHLTLEYVTPYDFVNFQCGHHKLYIIWRVFWATYHFVWIILTGVYSYQWAGHSSDQQVKWFIYLTDWAYFILTVSIIIDAISVIYISIKREDILQDISPIMPWYLKVNWVFFNISNTISVLMSILYWSLIYSDSEEMTAVNLETHALNMVYVILNLFLTGIPVRFYHLFHSMIFGIIYVIFSVIYEVSGGTNHQNKSYIYSVLDWSNTTNTVLLSLIVVFVAIPVCHVMIFLFYLIRRYCKKCCLRNKRSCNIITPDRTCFNQENCVEMNKKSEAKIDLDGDGLGNNETKYNIETDDLDLNEAKIDLDGDGLGNNEAKYNIDKDDLDLNEEKIDIEEDEEVKEKLNRDTCFCKSNGISDKKDFVEKDITDMPVSEINKEKTNDNCPT